MSFPGTGRRRRKSAAADVNPGRLASVYSGRGPTREDVWMRCDGGNVGQRAAGQRGVRPASARRNRGVGLTPVLSPGLAG
jgi:hypothetical protein